jgi:uncharacterized protein (DUF488 family)
MSASTEPASAEPPRIYTLGYAGWTLEEVAAVVAETGALLVDVRLKPWSRKPGFSTGALRKRLGDAYLSVPAFGNLNYRGGPVRLRDPAAGLAVLRPLLQERPAVLMCGCAAPEACHRRDVAVLLQEALGATVVHLAPPA